MVYYENKDWKENSVKRSKNPAGGNSIFLIAGECAESVNDSCTGKEEETWNDG